VEPLLHRCFAPSGRTANNRLVRRSKSTGGVGEDVQVYVADLDLANRVRRPLIDDVAGADDVAVVVLAREHNDCSFTEGAGKFADHLLAVGRNEVDGCGLAGLTHDVLDLDPFAFVHRALVDDANHELRWRHEAASLDT